MNFLCKLNLTKILAECYRRLYRNMESTYKTNSLIIVSLSISYILKHITEGKNGIL